jgi:hypothetical protein
LWSGFCVRVGEGDENLWRPLRAASLADADPGGLRGARGSKKLLSPSQTNHAKPSTRCCFSNTHSHQEQQVTRVLVLALVLFNIY